MPQAAKATTNHDEIRRWMESRGGKPACVKATKNKTGCLLRVDYPGYSGEDTLEEMDWDTFFRVFDENRLAFLHQDDQDSRFSKFVDRNAAGTQDH